MILLSVVCPFFNEEAILQESVERLMSRLSELDDNWELIIVNDGSTDKSLEVAYQLKNRYPRLDVISYPVNKGRGFALRTGIAHASGKIVITTEIDLSWGEDIIQRILKEFIINPDADIVVASPHLPSGGYKNVPLKRIFLSKYGNRIIRAGLSNRVTMNTGMTRGYIREKYLALPLEENGKEIHLEVINKALAFKYKIYEIPARLEWKSDKLSKKQTNAQRTSSKVNKHIYSHLLFSLGVAPFRYIIPISISLFLLSIIAFGIAIYKLFTPDPTIYWLLTSFFMALFGFSLFSIGVLTHQNREIIRELWRVRSELAHGKSETMNSEPKDSIE